MKKLLVILCLCSLLLAFAGCSDTAPAATETSTVTQETTTESMETPPESTETTAESMETTPESTTETTLETTAKPTSAPVEEGEVIKEYHQITNDAGKYTGVVFTLLDDSTYTWTCPVESLLPIVAATATPRENSPVYTIDYYIGNGEWLFDKVDVLKHTILYRHKKNDAGFRYTFGSFGMRQENGFIRRSADGKVTYDRDSWEGCYDYSLFQTNTLTAIREVIPLHPGDTPPQKTAYSHVFTTIPTNWVYDETDFMYYEMNFPDIRGYYYVRRLSGLDVLYYSEEPIEDFSAALAKELFPETKPSKKVYDIYGKTYNSYDGHSKIYFTRYLFDDGDFWADDPRGIDTDVSRELVAIVQLDAHYFAKVELYMTIIDETAEALIMPVLRNLMYFNESSETTVSEEDVRAESPTKDFTYTVNPNGGVTITGYTGQEPDIVIPSKVDGKDVTEIGQNAFAGKAMKSVRIPDSVRAIGNAAF